MANKKSALAGIEYCGVPGSSKDCLDAVMRFLQYGDKITFARILSYRDDHGSDHCLLLSINTGDLVAIKSGFASGYRGEGPSTFSHVIQLLEVHGTEIEEYQVSEDLIERVDSSSLTLNDLDQLMSARPVRPRRWQRYVFEEHWDRRENGRLWEEFPPVVPYSIIDSRIMDLALTFWDDADDKLLKGYRRLEDIVRQRTGIEDSGASLFSKAFLSKAAKLRWKGIEGGESVGRANLFIGTYMAHRNRRAHREVRDYSNQQLAEFLLLNHLFSLEAESEAADDRTS